MNQSSAYYQLGPLREHFEDRAYLKSESTVITRWFCDTFEGRKIIRRTPAYRRVYR